MQRPRILVVDDEAPIRELVRGYLEREGFEVEAATDGLAAVDAARASAPDVIVLDVMLPGLDGIEVCRRIRSISSPRELVARVRALLRRPRGAADVRSTTPVGFEIDESRRVVRIDGAPVALTSLEFDLLAVLARDPGIVIGRQALLDRVWGPEFVADDHLVDVHIANLRRKLGDDPARPRFIETVRGVGYRLSEAP